MKSVLFALLLSATPVFAQVQDDTRVGVGRGVEFGCAGGALMTLTRSRCSDADDRELQREWQAWWKANESGAEIYGTDCCP